MFKLADLSSLPIDVNLPPKGSQIIEVRPTLPETFGAYALVADLGPVGRSFAASCVRTFAPDGKLVQYPRMSLDADAGLDVIEKLNIHGIRLHLPYVPTTSPAYAPAMAELAAKLKECAEKKITVMFEIGEGGAPNPLGRPRPHLDENGVMLNTKQDFAWLPSSDADFQKFIATLCTKYGWPRGPVNALNVWNEPWEGISISGWGADSIRLREIFTAMANGADQARATGVQINTGGCESSTNTLDKLFADGRDTYLNRLDFISIHYQGLAAPSLFKKWINRDSPYGRVKVWDTESFAGNMDDRFSAITAMNRAAGYDRVMGIFQGNVATPAAQAPVKLPDGTLQKVTAVNAWSPAVAVGAATHFIGDRDFREILFKNGLPWVIVFDALKDKPGSGTVVVVGDVGDYYGDSALFHTVRGLAEAGAKEKLVTQLDALPADSPDRAALEKELQTKPHLSGASMTVTDEKHEFELRDVYGNLVPETDGKLTVPLDNRGFYLVTNGASGSFDRLLTALQQARIDGYEPLEIVAHDLLAPVDQKPPLRLTLTNVLNRPVSGKVTITLGNLTLNPPGDLSFQPHEVKEVEVPVTAGDASPDNTYPLVVRFDAAADGFAIHRENLHVNFITRKTITVDGNIDDWKDVLPQPVQPPPDSGPTFTEAAWFPFEKFSTAQQTGGATGYICYDDKNLYFAAKVADAAPSPGTLRFEQRNDDDYFYPQKSYEYDNAKTLLEKGDPWTSPTRTEGALLLPGSTTQRSLTMWSSVAGAFAVDLNLPEGSYKKVSFYFVDPDTYNLGRRINDLSVTDAASGKVLATTTVSQFGPGNYVSFLLSGKVRVVLRSKTFLPASLSAIFFDPADSQAPRPATPAAAQLLAPDLTTRGAWQGKFGQDGYVMAGADPKPPAYAKVDFPAIEAKTEHDWPEGVRRYSYRKKPDLPFGSSPKFDNVQLAFNVIPEDQKDDMLPNPPGTMPRYTAFHDTDYEYALNPIAPAFGGGTEVWRCWVPGMPRKDFYPRQPASPYDGPVKNAQLVVTQDGGFRIFEAAIPWTEIPLVKKAADAGKTIRFSFRVNLAVGSGMELAQNRSVSKVNCYTFHPDWVQHWANELEFRFQPPPEADSHP